MVGDTWHCPANLTSGTPRLLCSQSRMSPDDNLDLGRHIYIMEQGSHLGGTRASEPHSRSTLDKQKREVIHRANEQWRAEYKKMAVAAKAAERRRQFPSLAPPQQLVPFKDFDYYYTRGFTLWRSNTGQTFKASASPTAS